MNCGEFHNVIHDLAREEILDNATLSDALTHAESCRACDAQLREAERLTADLRSLAARHRSEAAPPRVEEALLAAFRQQSLAASRTARVGRWLVVSVAGVAAAVLLAVFLAGYPIGRSPVSPAGPEVAPRESNTPSPRQLWADYGAEEDSQEDAAEPFVPLSSTFDPSWIEYGSVVRVVLSRSALESFGVPVNGNEEGGIVADLVVSDDGTPEAIRAVNWEIPNIQ